MVTLVSFVVILWTLSGSLQVFGMDIPGYLVWVALVYAIAGTFLTHFIGRKLIGLDFNQQRVEADFRFSLVRLRENSEGIALYRGEAEELGGLRGRFAAVITNWWQIMYKRKQLGWFTSFYHQLAIIFPYIVVSPRFFSGQIPLGAIFQTASAFGQVQGSLSWFINAYTAFAQWKATVDRLIGFVNSLERVRVEADRLDGDRVEGSAPSLVLEDLAIALPRGEPLLAPTALELKPGENVLVTGPSGAGKSTFFRALSGIWPYWKGRIRLPHGARLLFLPQKPYLPIGTLKRAVCYPDDPAHTPMTAVRRRSRDVGLAHFAGELERSENWAQVLSGGEQQRLAFARISRTGCFSMKRPLRCRKRTRTASTESVKERLPHARSSRSATARASPRITQRQWRGAALVPAPGRRWPARGPSKRAEEAEVRCPPTSCGAMRFIFARRLEAVDRLGVGGDIISSSENESETIGERSVLRATLAPTASRVEAPARHCCMTRLVANLAQRSAWEIARAAGRAERPRTRATTAECAACSRASSRCRWRP